MGIHEMHIAIDLMIQKINSNTHRNILPEEKDTVLNWVIQEFVSDKIKQSRVENEYGFHNDEVDAAALSTLLKQFVPISVSPKDPNLYEIMLPADFRNFISFSAVTTPIRCLSESELLIPRTVEVTNYIYTLKVPEPSGSGPYFASGTANLNGIQHSWDSKGTTDPQFIRFSYLALQNVLQYNPLVKSVSWEKYPGRLKQKNTIIIESSERLNSLSLVTNGLTIQSVEVPITKTYMNRNAGYSSTFTAPANRIKPQFFPTVESSVFEKSKFDRINVTLSEDSILTPNEGNYIVTVGVLNYVRKPAEVNLSLGIDCDLPDTGDIHQLICARAAEEIMLSVESPNWQARFETNKIK